MKKNKRLSLHRETITRLSVWNLRNANGGTLVSNDTQCADCCGITQGGGAACPRQLDAGSEG